MSQPAEPPPDRSPAAASPTVDGSPPGALADRSPPGGPVDGSPGVPPDGSPPDGSPPEPVAAVPWATPAGWVRQPPAPSVPVRVTVLRMLAIALAVAALGVPFGLLWTVVAPDVPVLVTDRGPVYGAAQPEQLIAADGWFAILAVPVGLLAGIGVWLLAKRARGMPGLVALLAGAVGAGLLAWWVGRQVGLADYESTLAAAESGTRLSQPPDLAVVALQWWPPQVLGVLLVPALAAAATYTMLAAWSRFPGLRPEPDLYPRDRYGHPQDRYGAPGDHPDDPQYHHGDPRDQSGGSRDHYGAPGDHPGDPRDHPGDPRDHSGRSRDHHGDPPDRHGAGDNGYAGPPGPKPAV